jgi:predicted Zn finger-like uncharacterized protein
MLIVCPNCATSYQVETSSLGSTGRSVRCVRCRNVWFARDPSPLSAIAEAHRSDMQTLAASIAAVAHGEGAGGAPADEPAGEGAASAHTIEANPTAYGDTASSSFASAGGERPPGFAAEESDPWSSAPLAIADAPGLAPMEQGATLPADPTLDPGLGQSLGQSLGQTLQGVGDEGGATASEDIETVAARRFPRRKKRRSRWTLPGLPVAILALIAINAALIHWRANVVRIAPQTASLYAALGLPVNLRGLSFTDVTTTIESHDGVQVLVVEGKIASTSQRAVEVPRLRFSVRNRNGQEVYAWTALPGRNGLAPSETLTFRSRLASPPPDAREVLVRFFNRRDLVAGVQ